MEDGMKVFHIISLIMGVGLVTSSIKAIKEKKYLDLITLLLLFTFFLFFYISVIWGGSAFNDAQANYENYQAGCYYLMSHGEYTEVAYWQYLFMMVLEVVGVSSIPLSILWAIVREIIVIHKKTR